MSNSRRTILVIGGVLGSLILGLAGVFAGFMAWVNLHGVPMQERASMNASEGWQWLLLCLIIFVVESGLIFAIRESLREGKTSVGLYRQPSFPARPASKYNSFVPKREPTALRRYRY